MIHREQEIIQWAKDRLIIPESTPAAQFAKTRSEWNEWLRNRSMDDIGDVVVTLIIGHRLAHEQNLSESSAGTERVYFNAVDRVELMLKAVLGAMDAGITLDGSAPKEDYAQAYFYMSDLARLSGWTVEECIETAWQDIKDRRGMMLHGTFVKEATLDRLAVYGIYPAHGRLESVVTSPEQRSQIAGVITGAEFSADSKFDKESGTWLVFSTGLQKETA